MVAESKLHHHRQPRYTYPLFSPALCTVLRVGNMAEPSLQPSNHNRRWRAVYINQPKANLILLLDGISFLVLPIITFYLYGGVSFDLSPSRARRDEGGGTKDFRRSRQRKGHLQIPKENSTTGARGRHARFLSHIGSLAKCRGGGGRREAG